MILSESRYPLFWIVLWPGKPSREGLIDVIYWFKQFGWRLAQRRSTGFSATCIRSLFTARVVSRRADPARGRLHYRPARALHPSDPCDPVHRRVRPGHSRTWLGAILAGLAGHRDLGSGLLRRHAGRPAFGYHRHARHGPGTAHLVRRARLFPAWRDARGAVLDFDLGTVAVRHPGRTVQFPEAPAARFRP